MAQERKKRRIVLASILKPVDDTRMFEKFGASLAQSGAYEVFIIGFPSRNTPAAVGIECIPLKPFRRLSLNRLLARWQVFQLARRLSPDIVIFTSHELIFPALLLKLQKGVRIVYDIRENYFRNILHSRSFPKLISFPLAFLVRLKEKITAPFIDYFLLAEKGYEIEIGFHKRAWSVIENKAIYPSHSVDRTVKPDTIKLFFSGTLAESTGVFDAIRLAAGMHDIDPSVNLTLAGYSAQQSVLERIHHEIRNRPYIQLVGGSELVPHSEILKLIQTSDAGILAYPPSDHTRNSRPTKLFEYLSARLPIILENHWPWIGEFESCHPFLFTSFQSPDYPKLVLELRSNHYYTAPPTGVDWGSEAPKLLRALENV